MLLTLRHHPRLLRHFLQAIQNHAIPRLEPMNQILNLRLCAKLPHQHLQRAQIVPRHAREQMVYNLELQPAVHEIQPRRARNVHGRAQLALGEGFSRPQVGRARAPVRERDLHVQRHGYQVAGQEEESAGGPGRDVAVQQHVEVEHEVDGDAGDFGRASPPRFAFGVRAWGKQVAPGEEVEVEARDGHDGVVGVFLDSDGDGRDGVVEEFEAWVVG